MRNKYLSLIFTALLLANLGFSQGVCGTFEGSFEQDKQKYPEFYQSLESVNADLEKQYNEKDKTESETFKWKYKDHYLEGKSIPSIDYVYKTAQKLLPGITMKEVNKLSLELISSKNKVITASSPENENIIIPIEEDLMNKIEYYEY